MLNLWLVFQDGAALGDGKVLAPSSLSAALAGQTGPVSSKVS